MDLERHSRARQIELGQSLADHKKIYLDACFWIMIRDAFLGARNDVPAQEFLSLLRRGVANNQFVCPMSTSMFFELFKQPYTPGRRIGTAKIIDELSRGVTMAPPPIVLGTEIHAFLLASKGDVDLHPMQELIWTKIANVLGVFSPKLDHLSLVDELTAQKQFFDHLWDHSLTDLVEVIGDEARPSDEYDKLSKEINVLNADHSDELRSFVQTYDLELRGIIEIVGDVAADVILALAQQDAGHKLILNSDERANLVNMCRNLLYHGFKKPDAKSALRSIHIGAALHAGMRWDKERQFKPNDYYDFEHATAALGYCDMFFTDGPLHHLVTRPQLNLEVVNGCKVISDLQSAVEHVLSLS